MRLKNAQTPPGDIQSQEVASDIAGVSADDVPAEVVASAWPTLLSFSLSLLRSKVAASMDLVDRIGHLSSALSRLRRRASTSCYTAD
jgi:hypothetical protein